MWDWDQPNIYIVQGWGWHKNHIMMLLYSTEVKRILKATSTNHNWGENVTNPAGSQYETEKVWMDNTLFLGVFRRLRHKRDTILLQTSKTRNNFLIILEKSQEGEEIYFQEIPLREIFSNKGSERERTKEWSAQAGDRNLIQIVHLAHLLLS